MPRKPSSSPATPRAATAGSSSSLPASLADASLPLPRLIVFDLDYTLWPFWVDTHVTPPLKPNAQRMAATDRTGEEYAFYSEVPSILQMLPQAGGGGIRLGVASRTSAPGLARELLQMLHVPAGEGHRPRRALDVLQAGGLEIYPASKLRHMEALQKRTGVPYHDVLFFDDESRNRETEQLGLTMWLVRDGLTWDEVEQGVAEWRRRRQRRIGEEARHETRGHGA